MSATTLKRLPLDANSFEANGHKYIIYPSLGIERYRHFERMQVIAGFGADYQTLYAKVDKAYGLINKVKIADAAVEMNGIIEGIKRPIGGQQHPLLLLCTMFISREGEDLTRWDEAEAAEKITDWSEEGYDVADFFQYALGLARRFARASAGDSQDILPSEAPIETAPE